jgi:hypothetical protein
MTSGSCGALQRRLGGEFLQASPEYAVEGWKWVDDVGERLQRNAQLDRSPRRAGCHRDRVPSTARVWRPWGSRRSVRHVRRRGDERAGRRSTFRSSEAESWRVRSPSTGTHLRPAPARGPRVSARYPEGPPRSLLQRRHYRDIRRQIPAASPYPRDHHRRQRHYEECPRNAETSIRPWYRFWLTRRFVRQASISQG